MVTYTQYHRTEFMNYTTLFHNWLISTIIVYEHRKMLAFNLALKFRMSYSKILILCRKITKHKSSAIHFQQKEGREGWEKVYSEYFYVQIKLLCIEGLMFAGFSIMINIYYKCHSPSLWNRSRFKSNKCSTQTAVTSYLITKWTRNTVWVQLLVCCLLHSFKKAAYQIQEQNKVMNRVCM